MRWTRFRHECELPRCDVSLAEQQPAVRASGTVLEFSNCPPAHTSGQDARRRYAESQSADREKGSSECRQRDLHKVTAQTKADVLHRNEQDSRGFQSQPFILTVGHFKLGLNQKHTFLTHPFLVSQNINKTATP